MSGEFWRGICDFIKFCSFSFKSIFDYQGTMFFAPLPAPLPIRCVNISLYHVDFMRSPSPIRNSILPFLSLTLLSTKLTC